MVLANHCAHTLGAPTNFGDPPFGLLFQFGRSGADLFFVLSGFLIAFIHWKDLGHPERLLHYLSRRITRIYPTYWLVLLAVVPFDYVTHTLFDQYDQPFQVLKNIFLLPVNDTIIDVTWSLRNELLFYALFGLLIFNRKFGTVAMVAWFGALIATPLFRPELDLTWFNLLTYPMNFEFIAGIAAGWAIQRMKITRPGILLAVGLLVFAGFAIAEDLRLLWTDEDHLWYPGASWDLLIVRCAGYGIAGVLIIVGATGLEMTGRIRMPRPMVLLGEASYLLYLIHVPALLILGASERYLHLLRFMPPWVLATVFILLIVATAILLNNIVEKPLLRIIRPRRTLQTVEPTSALI